MNAHSNQLSITKALLKQEELQKVEHLKKGIELMLPSL